MPQSLFYDWRHNSKPLGHGSGVKPGEEDGDSVSYQFTTVFVKQPLALPGSAKYYRGNTGIVFLKRGAEC